MKKILIIILSCFTLLQACTAFLAGSFATTAVTGAAVVHDRRSAGTMLDNKTLMLGLESKINNEKDIYENSHININIYDTTLLITGEAKNEAIRERITEIVRNNVSQDIQRIANYIIIGENSTLSNRFYDSKITSRVKAVLGNVDVETFDSSRVKVVTEHAVVFLMGIVSQEEANAVIDVTSRVDGISQVVTLFEIDKTIAIPKATINSTSDTYR